MLIGGAVELQVLQATADRSCFFPCWVLAYFQLFKVCCRINFEWRIPATVLPHKTDQKDHVKKTNCLVTLDCQRVSKIQLKYGMITQIDRP